MLKSKRCKWMQINHLCQLLLQFQATAQLVSYHFEGRAFCFQDTMGTYSFCCRFTLLSFCFQCTHPNLWLRVCDIWEPHEKEHSFPDFCFLHMVIILLFWPQWCQSPISPLKWRKKQVLVFPFQRTLTVPQGNEILPKSSFLSLDCSSSLL